MYSITSLIPRDISVNVKYWKKFFEQNNEWFCSQDKRLYYRDVLEKDLSTLTSWMSYEENHSYYLSSDSEESDSGSE